MTSLPDDTLYLSPSAYLAHYTLRTWYCTYYKVVFERRTIRLYHSPPKASQYNQNKSKLTLESPGELCKNADAWVPPELVMYVVWGVA